jgi:hypothetical protein
MLFLVILILGAAAQFFPVWWLVVPVAFVASVLLGKSPRQAFWSAFAANALVWGALIAFQVAPSNPLLFQKLSGLFMLPHWSLLIVLAVLIGGLISGLSALSGQYTRQFIKK